MNHLLVPLMLVITAIHTLYGAEVLLGRPYNYRKRPAESYEQEKSDKKFKGMPTTPELSPAAPSPAPLFIPPLPDLSATIALLIDQNKLLSKVVTDGLTNLGARITALEEQQKKIDACMQTTEHNAKVLDEYKEHITRQEKTLEIMRAEHKQTATDLVSDIQGRTQTLKNYFDDQAKVLESHKKHLTKLIEVDTLLNLD